MPTMTADPGTKIHNLYRQPTVEELMNLCVDFELITDIRRDGELLHLQVKDEEFHVSVREAEFLIRGLLLGYFAMHTRDDLSLANWDN